MMTSRQPVCFVATTEPALAKSFYRDVLDLRLAEESPFALVFADGDITLRVQIVRTLSPASHTVHGWQVAHIDHDIAELAAKGIVFLRFDGLLQSDSEVWTTPDGHKIAWFNDPCGNVLSLTEYVAS